MPTSITNVTTGTAINANALRDYARQIEYWLNEGSVAGDIQDATPWVTSTHIYAPEFKTGLAPWTRLVSGSVHWRSRPHDTARLSVHHSEVNAAGVAGTPGAWVNVEGCTATFSVPTRISAVGNPAHRVRAKFSWYTHEIGGDGSPQEGAGADQQVADFAVAVDGTVKTATVRPLFTASAGDGQLATFAAKQYSAQYPARIDSAGEHSIGLKIRMYSRGVGLGSEHNNWRHVFVWGRTSVLSWFRL